MSTDAESEVDTENQADTATDAEASGDAAAAELESEATTGPSAQEERMAAKAGRSEDRVEAEVAEETAREAEDTVHLRIFRYDPDVDAKSEPRFDDFHVPHRDGLSVLDAVIYARDHFDSTLTFRHSCRQGVCGSDAFFVNGRQRLGCQTQVGDLEEPIRIEPLPHQDVVKDLVVDMEHFYDQMRAVDPFFDPDEDPPGDLEEYRQSRENREAVKMSTRCIWCGACMSSCNIASGDNQYLGPAAINKAYRFAMDDREGEERKRERIETIEAEHGVWRCQTQFSCTEVCPKDIPLTEHIQSLKREAVKQNLKFW